jgi:predicted nucleic acid-binding protein
MAKKEESASRGVTETALVLDSGAVIALSRGNPKIRVFLRRALEVGVDVRIPAAVLTEVFRGGPKDAPVHRVRRALHVAALQERTARHAGELLGRTRGKNSVDAMVVAEALEIGADIFTSDLEDIEALIPHGSLICAIRV